MNAIGSACIIAFIIMGVAGAVSGLWFFLFQAVSALHRDANARERAAYNRMVRYGQTAFLWCWIGGAAAFGLGAWLGGWDVDY